MQWNRTSESWNDPVSKRFENEYLVPLERAVVSSCEAMGTMNEAIQRAQRDCE